MNNMKLGSYILGPTDDEHQGIYTGDCRELAKAIPDRSVDLILTDPPYGVLGDKFSWDAVVLEPFTVAWWDIARHKLKSNSAAYIFWSQKFLPMGFEIFEPDRMLIWHHPNLAKPTNHMFLWTYDPVFYMQYGKPPFHASFSGGTNTDVITLAKPQSNWRKNYRYHPASKPEALIKRFVSISSGRQSVVLDLFCGGGTLPVICKQLGRHWLAFEEDPGVAEQARERVRFTNPPLPLPEPEQEELWR